MSYRILFVAFAMSKTRPSAGKDTCQVQVIAAKTLPFGLQKRPLRLAGIKVQRPFLTVDEATVHLVGKIHGDCPYRWIASYGSSTETVHLVQVSSDSSHHTRPSIHLEIYITWNIYKFLFKKKSCQVRKPCSVVLPPGYLAVEPNSSRIHGGQSVALNY